ncbi:dihydrodipicolinate synthase family protein [Sphingobacterium chuzhouense]|uniref:Dihydrodipicolinate synthase family protein n=1 Tax=Sphingobacterium chuzhouense TaxID=1742264 RepID=A0ABR7XTV3_9SPHI|nr:dihydrodipicolinate synthase family protein [Sphingobacterium chuzhouense]MBD1422332.1 dihydrodipicolinate synthase family protein [Sphingobacterium chuzhouense]
MKKDIKGVVVPLITPLKDRATVDKEGLERLIDYVVDGGVDSLFVLGTTGEGPGLSNEVKNEVIVYTNHFLRGRTKNLIGITDTSPEESIKWSRIAADNGADAVVLAPPPYFPYTQKELVTYVRYVIRHSPLPVILYNIPRLTKTVFETEAIKHLMDEKGVIGFKDSSKDWEYFKDVLHVTKQRPDWTLLTGTEELLAQSMEAGADGGVLGGANIFPKLLSDFYAAIKRKNAREVSALEGILSDCRPIYAMGCGATSSIQVIKYVLEQQGICQRMMTQPFNDLDEDAGRRVSERIALYVNNRQSIN